MLWAVQKAARRWSRGAREGEELGNFITRRSASLRSQRARTEVSARRVAEESMLILK